MADFSTDGLLDVGRAVRRLDKRSMIPGWPNPSTEQIAVFQRNNGLKDDGVIGEKTLAKIWAQVTDPPTVLSLEPVDIGGAEVSRAFVDETFDALEEEGELAELIPLPRTHIHELMDTATSGWMTGFSYMSGRDGLTMGCRRQTGEVLRRLLLRTDLARQHLGAACFQLLHINRFKAGQNNGLPLNHKYLRVGLLSLAAEPEWWRIQIDEMLRFFNQIRYQGCLVRNEDGDEEESWRYARSWKLMVHAGNSSPRYIRGVEQLVESIADPEEREREAFRLVKQRYSDSETHLWRIRHVEESTPEDLTW